VAPLVGSADTILLVTRPTLEGVEHVRARLEDAPDVTIRRRIVVLLVGDRPYPSDEVARLLPVPLAGLIALDGRGLRALEDGATGVPLRRSALVRSARTVLGELDRLFPHPAEVAS
jgi:hypothetical protein